METAMILAASDLYRLVYASKNLLTPDDDPAGAIEEILRTSRRNNGAAGITGALLFNSGAFAQVLEGPRHGVEQTFERIQRDMRHGDVTVLQCGPIESRGFPNWSMAHVGRSPQGQQLWSGLAAESGFDLTRLDGDAVFSMLHALVLEEEDVPAPAGPTTAQAAEALVTGFDETRIRAELMRGALHETASTPPAPREEPARPAVPAAPALGILRAALAEERRRTTALREELDDLRIALAAGEGQLAGLREERDLWAERARLLAATLCQEAEAVRHAALRPIADEGFSAIIPVLRTA
ncbi:MAG: BLUF domain-containing protein [Methylobacterium frigidaeris]